ncbi:retrotransposon protein, putative, ty1-copia subclass [Tanacetum coccineum]
MTAELHKQFENSSPYDMIKELKAMFEKQIGVERFDLIQTFHACKQEQGKPVVAQDVVVDLIHMEFTTDFFGFVRNYNMHNTRKTVGELHVMLIEYEKGLPKKAETPQVMMIKGGKIQKANKKSLKAKSKGKANEDVATNCKDMVIWKRNCPMYLAELLKKKNTKRAKHNLDSTYLWHCRLAHISKKHIEKLQHEGLLKSTDDESFDQCVSFFGGGFLRKDYDKENRFPHRLERATDLLGIIHTDVFKNEVENQLGKTIKSLRSDRGGKYISQEFKDYLKACGIFQQLTPPYTPQHNDVSKRRNHTLLDMVQSMMNLTTLPLSFWDYALESAIRILNMVWGCEALVKQDTPDNLQQDLLSVSLKISKGKRMNVQSKGQYGLVHGHLPPDYKIVGSKWFFNKKTDMDGNVHTYKARLVAKGFTQTYGVDYEEMFSLVTDIRAIRILIAIAGYYDYKIWKMDVKTTFLNGYLDEDIYMASGSNVTFLILYVDDIIVIGNHIPSLQSVKTYLGKCFAMKYLGEAAFILGIKIYRDRSKRLIGLSQGAYMDKILKRYRMDNSKRGYIPMQERLDLNKTQGASTPEEVKRMQNVPYASAVGSIVNTKDMLLVYGGNPEAEW